MFFKKISFCVPDFNFCVSIQRPRVALQPGANLKCTVLDWHKNSAVGRSWSLKCTFKSLTVPFDL